MLSLGGIAQDKRVALNFPKHDHPILKIIKFFSQKNRISKPQKNTKHAFSLPNPPISKEDKKKSSKYEKLHMGL